MKSSSPTKSGSFVLRIAPETHARLHELAQREGISLNQFCKKILEQGCHLDETPAPRELLNFLGKKNLAPLGVVLFGSQARGTSRTNSDIDLLIVFPDGTPIHRSLYQATQPWSDQYPQYSLHFVTLPSPHSSVGSLWLEVSLDGKILIDTEDQLAHTLSRLRREVAAGKYIRKISHGHGYWSRGSDAE